MASERFRLEAQFCVEHKPIKRIFVFWAQSQKAACEKFRRIVDGNSSIHEAGLFRVRDDKLIADRVKYI